MILHNINFVKIIVERPKKKLIPEIKCTMLLEQLYYMYNNIKSKSVPKGVNVVCFHPIHVGCKYENLNPSQGVSL
jgi:hypothetical protein